MYAGKLCLAVSVLLFVAPQAGARRRFAGGGPGLTEQDKLYWEAAQALYGVGLDIKRTRKRTTIAPKPGGLTRAKYNRYVKEVYLQVLRAHLTKMTGGNWRWSEGGYGDTMFDNRAPVKRAHLLLEPYLKYRLCREIAASIGSKPNIVAAWQRYGWCALQAMDEAVAPIYVYRGAAVTWEAPADRGDLDVVDEIWKPDAGGNYPMVVTVAGGHKIYTLASTKILMKLSKDVDPDLAKKLHAKADRIYKKTLKIYHGLVKKEARKQRRLARGKKIIFAARRFYATVAIPPARGPIPCRKTHYLAYVPAKARKQGYHIAVEIDGTECMSLYADAGEVDRNDIYAAPSCSRLLRKGEHKVNVALHHSVDSFNHSQKEWRRSNMRWKRENVTYTKTKKGRKLYEGSITCTVD